MDDILYKNKEIIKLDIKSNNFYVVLSYIYMMGSKYKHINIISF